MTWALQQPFSLQANCDQVGLQHQANCDEVGLVCDLSEPGPVPDLLHVKDINVKVEEK